MKKKIFICIVAVMMAVLSLIGLSVSAAGTEDGVAFKTSKFETMQGETFKTTIYLDENSNLIDFQLQLKYNSDYVELVEVAKCADLEGTMQVTEKSGGLIHLSYTRTSSNLTEKTNLVDVTFKVNENIGIGTYEFLTIDEKYANEGHTMVGLDLVELNLVSNFSDLVIYQSGDVSLDSKVSIADVTYLRQHLAYLRTLSDFQLKFADTYYDERVSITDAVRIQQSLATDDLLLGNRINVKFYDKDGNLYATKSVKYGEELLKIPEVPVVSGYASREWSMTKDTYTSLDLTNLQHDVNVYAVYGDPVSAEMQYYKDRLADMYYNSNDVKVEGKNVLSGNLSLCNQLNYQGTYTAEVYWTSSNSATFNSTTGVFSQPTYDSTLSLTATILSRKDGYLLGSDTITFDYFVDGKFSVPQMAGIKDYLTTLIGTEISYDMDLPKKLTNNDIPSSNESEYEIRLEWAIQNSDNSLEGISAIQRTTETQNVTLVATVTFGGEPLEGDGKIYFDNITLSAITEDEIRKHVINEIARNTGVSLSTNEELWSDENTYGSTVKWESNNHDVATIENNIITVSPNAVDGETLPLTVKVTYGTDAGAKTFSLAYTVTVVSDNEVLKPNTNIDPELYDVLKSVTGVHGDLTTNALKNITFVYLDLSGHESIASLEGIAYCKNLRVLNISGLKYNGGSVVDMPGFNEIASLTNLQAFIAKDCGITNLDSGVEGGSGVPLFTNMANLQMVDLSDNNLTSLDSVFAEDKKYGKLFELYLNNNQLTDISAIKKAPVIDTLVLSDNELESDDLTNLSEFKYLSYLSIADNNIDNLAALSRNESLLELRAQNNNISDLSDICGLLNLRALYLGNNNISNNATVSGSETNIYYLSLLKNLKVLYLNDNNINNISGLKTLTNLKALNVSNNKINNLDLLGHIGSGLEELYAENNEIASFAHVQYAPKLKKLMLSGNEALYEESLPSYLSGLTELQTLTLSGKPLTTLEFVENMPNLIRLDVANCDLPCYSILSAGTVSNGEETILEISDYVDNIAYLQKLKGSLKFLDISNNGMAYNATDMLAYLKEHGNNFDDVTSFTFTNGEPTQFVKLYEMINLVSLYADNVTADYDASSLLSLMTNLKYLSLENNGIKDVSWLNRFRELEYVNLARNDIEKFDFSYINEDNKKVLKYLYLDSNVDCEFADANTSYVGNALVELSLRNHKIPAMDYLPKMENIKVLNLANTGLTDLYGSNPSGIFSIDRYAETLETIDVSDNDLDTSILGGFTNLKNVYAVGTPKQKLFYNSSLNTLYDLYNSDVNAYLYGYDEVYAPDSTREGTLILNEIEDFSCDIKVAGDNTISDNNPFIPSEINGYDITWDVSNSTNYDVIDNKLTVIDYAGIENETLTLTANITVYPSSTPVTRDFTINTNIIRVNTDALDINADGIGDNLSRDALFNYDVKIKPITVDGFENQVMPVYDEINYSYVSTLASGESGVVEDALIENENHSYTIAPNAPLESTLTINVAIGHYANGEFISDHNIERNIVIASRTFNVNYISNGGSVVTNEGAVVNKESYIEDSVLFANSRAVRDGYTFAGWFTDEALSTPFGLTTMPSEDITLYAKWNINTYTVTFNTTGGSAIEPQAVVYDTVATKPANPTRDLYLFVGWYKDAAYTTEWNFATDIVSGDTTIYAKWIYMEYNVKFNANGGSVGTSSKKVRYKEKYGTLPTPTRDHYNFNGWYTAASGGTKVTQDTILNVTNDVTIYAQWTQKDKSGWVLKSSMPAGGKITDTKYTYTLTSTTTSSSSSMSGWTHYDTTYVWGGWSSWINYDPGTNGGNRKTETRWVDTSYNLREYHYYAWTTKKNYCYTTKSYANSTGTGTAKLNEVWLTYELPYMKTSGGMDYYGPGPAGHYGTDRYFKADGTSGGLSPYIRDTWISQGYTQWRYSDKVFTYHFKKVENKEQTSYPSGSNISNIQEWVRYIPK